VLCVFREFPVIVVGWSLPPLGGREAAAIVPAPGLSCELIQFTSDAFRLYSGLPVPSITSARRL